jgi:hypothetical protein
LPWKKTVETGGKLWKIWVEHGKKHGQTIEKMRGKYKESFTDPKKLA